MEALRNYYPYLDDPGGIIRRALNALASALIAGTPELDAYTVEGPSVLHMTAAITDGDGMICLYPSAGRLIISGSLGAALRGTSCTWEGKREISVSLDKSQEKIVAEVRRRFIPNYLQNIARVKSVTEAYAVRCREAASNASRIVAASAGLLSKREFEHIRNDDSAPLLLPVQRSGVHGIEFEVKPGFVNIKANWIPVELAERIAAVMGDFYRADVEKAVEVSG